MTKMLPPAAVSRPAWDTLETFARTPVQAFIQQLLEDEVTALLGRPKSARRTPLDAPVGARNGHGKPRHLALMNGTMTVRRPRVRDLEDRFVSRLLPLFQRRTTAVSALLPELYLHGLALGDFELALRGVLGDAAPLSASSLVRLKATWQAQYTAWQQRDLGDCRLVDLWADGVYVKAGLDTSMAALLVLIGADAEGQQHVLAVTSGQRESTESWEAARSAGPEAHDCERGAALLESQAPECPRHRAEEAPARGESRAPGHRQRQLRAGGDRRPGCLCPEVWPGPS